MTAWNDLHGELDAWRAEGRRATFWCRDDDATRDTPALHRLLDIAKAHAVPVALAVIPAGLEPGLIEVVRGAPEATVLQHGYAHRNHALPPDRSCELGHQRPLADCMAELLIGRETLARAFGSRFLPVVVPPWNRIHAEVVAALSQAGYRGLSTFGPRAAPHPVPGLVQCNTHVDLVAWRSGRRFIGTPRAIARVVEHLRARRLASVDADEVTGILTHHLDLADEAWEFADALMARTRAHGAADWLAAGQVFADLSS